MSKTLEMMASAIQKRPHSFQFIRKATGLKLTDQEFTTIAKSDQGRFKLVRFLKRDDEGVADSARPARCGAPQRLRVPHSVTVP